MNGCVTICRKWWWQSAKTKQLWILMSLIFLGAFVPTRSAYHRRSVSLYVINWVTGVQRTWATRTVGQAATKRHSMAVADIMFEKEKTRRNSINTCRPIKLRCTKTRTMTLCRPNPTPTAANKVLGCLPFCLYHLLFGFGTLNNLSASDWISWSWLVKFQ